MDTRGRIMEAAARLFFTQGYNNTGINQVIKEAGVAKASLYDHFSSKDELLLEYLKITAINTNAALTEVTAKHKTPRQKILAIFDFLEQHTKQNAFLGCHFLNIAAEIPTEHPKVKALIRKQKNAIRELFAKILQPAGKQQLADELYILFDAALATSKVFNDTWPVKTTRKIAGKLI